MELTYFKRDVNTLVHTLDRVKKEKIDLKSYETSPMAYDFKEKKIGYYKLTVNRLVRSLNENVCNLNNPELTLLVKNLDKYYQLNKTAQMLIVLDEISTILVELKDEGKEAGLSFKLPKLPAEINKEMLADVEELKQCFKAGYYRSSVMLCGRILETALQRRYYEETGKDILETAPGLGLGKIIAKLRELNIDLGPGINEQVHLINQIRIKSIHKQNTVFNPSKEQTMAAVLYTLDIIKNLWR